MSFQEVFSTLVLSSEDLPLEGNVRQKFQREDPPPLEMKLQVDTKFLDLSVRAFNNYIKVYLSRYLLDCVWRDALDPSQEMTSNAGTSLSRRIKVYLFAGDPDIAPVRLLDEPVHREAGADRPDFFLYRDQNVVNEKAHNLYDTNVNLPLELYFENQFTQQAEQYVDPGLYLGALSAQAIMALRSTSLITIRWKLDRPDHPSPFWYNRFLVGSSVWNPATGKFQIVDAGSSTEEFAEYHKKMESVEVTGAGGPYLPLSLYTFDQPFNSVVAPFMEQSSVYNVSDPQDGEIYPLNDDLAKVFLGQVALANTVNVADLNVSGMNPVAASDDGAFVVSSYDASAASTSPLSIPASAPRYATTFTNGNVTSSIHYPNGAWRGQVLESKPTSLSGWSSPYPWEQRLTLSQLAIANETLTYPVDSTAHRYELLNCLDYLFMDPGTAWNEHLGTTTVGERALQMDFGVGREHFINKFQLLFPRSQENHQPYRLGASMQKAYRDSADNVVRNDAKAFWFGGVQFNQPSGSRSSPDDYRYLNTHTQMGSGMDQSSTTLWEVNINDRSTPPSDGGIRLLTASDYEPGSNRVVKSSLDHLPAWYLQHPNAVNPAFDFKRQEFGPFTRGATLLEMKDELLCKGFISIGDVEVPGGTLEDLPSPTFFYDLPSYLLSPQNSTGVVFYGAQTDPLWLQQTSLPPTAAWTSVASSMDGTRLGAVTSSGNMFLYADDQWQDATTGAGLGYNWQSIAFDGSGDTMVAAAVQRPLRISKNEGATWGNVSANTYVWSSTSGTWVANTVSVGVPQQKNWMDVALASDGRTGYAVTSDECLYKYVVQQGGRLSISQQRGETASFYRDIALSMDNGNVACAIASSDYAVFINEASGVQGQWFNYSPWQTGLRNGYYRCVALSPSVVINQQTNETNVRLVIGTEYNGLIKAQLAGSWEFSRFGSTLHADKIWESMVFAGYSTLWAADTTGTVYRVDVTSWSSPVWGSGEVLGGVGNLGKRVRLSSSLSGKTLASYRDGSVFYNPSNTESGWIVQTSLNTRSWTAVAISGDGTHAAAAASMDQVFVGVVSDTTIAWTQVQPLGVRNWTTVALSNDASTMYVGDSPGYLYRSSDYGATWTRDVTPTLSTSTWTPVVNEAWSKVLVKDQDYGLAFPDNSRRLLRLGNAAILTEVLISRLNNASFAWRGVACSDDSAIATAVVYGGAVYTTTDGGETWTSVASLGNRTWTCTAMTPDGRHRIAMADTGHVAVYRNNAWQLFVTPYPWTSVACDSTFTTVVATSGSQGIFVSNDQGQTWALDTRLDAGETTKAWSAIAASGNGIQWIAAAGGPAGIVRVLREGNAYVKMSNNDTFRDMLTGSTIPKLVVSQQSVNPQYLLPGSYDENDVFTTDVYRWFLERYQVYRVAGDLLNRSPTYEELISQSTFKVYEEFDGSMRLTTDSPAVSILENFVGPTDTMVGVYEGRTYLIHPFFTSPQSVSTNDYLTQTNLIVNPLVTKYVLPIFSTTKSSIIVGPENGNLVVNWNNEEYDIQIPAGNYANVAVLNEAFKLEMDALYMYTLEPDNERTYYLQWTEEDFGARLTITPVPRGNVGVSYPSDQDWTDPRPFPWPYGNINGNINETADPTIKVGIGGFGDIVGFTQGEYPAGETADNTVVTSRTSDFLPQWVTTTLTGASLTFQSSFEFYQGIHIPVGNREAMIDYIVKESYYFAPGYDQYDTKRTVTRDGFTWLSPSDADGLQKMVIPQFGVGRYFGANFGSFLFDQETPSLANTLYTRGQGNLMKLFSFRPITQLFSFQTDSGFLKDKTGTATNQATFTNSIERGMLTSANVKDGGSKYFSKDTTTAYLQPTLDDNVQGAYYNSETGAFHDTPMYLLTNASSEIVQKASNDQLAVAKHASVEFTMADDESAEPISTYVPSTKAPLNRSAEFHLRFVRGQVTGLDYA